MKNYWKMFLIAVLIIMTCFIAVGCSDIKTGNRITAGRDVQTFTYAYVRLGDKDIVEGYITQWRDYENSDVVQVLINGKYYLTHYSCVVMIADPSHGSLTYSDPEYYVDE